MTDAGYCGFGVYKETIGTDGTTNYSHVDTLPDMLVDKISMQNTLNKNVVVRPPVDGEEQNPIIVPMGVKSKVINFSGTFKDCAYVMGEAPPIDMIPRSAILKLESDPGCVCPEFDDSTGYWKVKSVSWTVDSKSMLWKADIQTTFAWTDPKESMFFE